LRAAAPGAKSLVSLIGGDGGRIRRQVAAHLRELDAHQASSGPELASNHRPWSNPRASSHGIEPIRDSGILERKYGSEASVRIQMGLESVQTGLIVSPIERVEQLIESHDAQ